MKNERPIPMTHYLAELYSPRQQWLSLDEASRTGFFETIGAGMGALSALGIEAIALGRTEATTLNAPTQQFFAIWRAPDATAMQALIKGIAASGWHNYFDTINATGAGGDLNAHLAELAAL